MTQRTQTLALITIGVMPFALNGFYNPHLAQDPVLFWWIDVLSWIVLPSFIFLSGIRWQLFRPSDLGFTATIPGTQNDALLVATFVICIPALFWIDATTLDLAARSMTENHFAVPFSYAQMIPPPGPTTGWYRLLAITYLATSAGVVEEFYYRGMTRLLFGRGLIQTALYVLTSSLLFAAVHWKSGAYTMAEAFGFGLAAATLFAMTKNLWPLIAAHCLIDLHYFG